MQRRDAITVVVQTEDKLEYSSDCNNSITPMNQLLMALRFHATGTFQLVVGDTFDICKATVCRAVNKVTEAIAALRSKYVKFPASPQQRQDIMNLFYTASKMPGVLGATDCTHVPIQSPGGDDAEIYRNRKGYFSINVQLVCDYTGYISNVVARWPGSVHDSTIFDNCQLRALLQTGPHHGVGCTMNTSTSQSPLDTALQNQCVRQMRQFQTFKAQLYQVQPAL